MNSHKEVANSEWTYSFILTVCFTIDVCVSMVSLTHCLLKYLFTRLKAVNGIHSGQALQLLLSTGMKLHYTHTFCLLWDNVKLLHLVVQFLLLMCVFNRVLTLVGHIHTVGRSNYCKRGKVKVFTNNNSSRSYTADQLMHS